MEELVPHPHRQLDVEGGGEEGEEPVEGDQADLNVVHGEHLVKGWQVDCHLEKKGKLLVEKGEKLGTITKERRTIWSAWAPQRLAE